MSTRHDVSCVAAWRRASVLVALATGCLVILGCGGSSEEAKKVNWAEIESKVDPKLLMKKKAHGKGFEPVEREERRRILNEAKKKMEG